MKTLKLSLLLLIVFLFVSSNAFAATIQSYYVECPDGNLAHTLIWFDDNGRPKAASGIGCDGKVWSKTWEWLVSSGGLPTVSASHGLTPGTITVRSNQNVDLQIMDIEKCELVGSVIAVSANTNTSVDVSGLTAGHLYGLFYTVGGKVAAFEHFQKL